MYLVDYYLQIRDITLYNKNVKNDFKVVALGDLHLSKSVDKRKIDAIKKQINLEGYGLDLGCGLGVIGIALIKTFHVKMDMIDINKTAVRLTNENLIKNNVQHSAKAYFSDGFENVGEKYDFIISNPPIKSGKTMLFNLMKETYNHLKDNGQLILVIRKNHGMESLKKYLISIYSNCEIIARDKGYYILKSLKTN